MGAGAGPGEEGCREDCELEAVAGLRDSVVSPSRVPIMPAVCPWRVSPLPGRVFVVRVARPGPLRACFGGGLSCLWARPEGTRSLPWGSETCSACSL